MRRSPYLTDRSETRQASALPSPDRATIPANVSFGILNDVGDLARRDLVERRELERMFSRNVPEVGNVRPFGGYPRHETQHRAEELRRGHGLAERVGKVSTLDKVPELFGIGPDGNRVILESRAEQSPEDVILATSHVPRWRFGRLVPVPHVAGVHCIRRWKAASQHAQVELRPLSPERAPDVEAPDVLNQPAITGDEHPLHAHEPEPIGVDMRRALARLEQAVRVFDQRRDPHESDRVLAKPLLEDVEDIAVQCEIVVNEADEG